jgi:nucleotide-binding universal stress UspA family protein
MKVLVGVDDSPHAETTLEAVQRMPWPADTKFVVVSAVQMPFGAYSEPYAPVAADVSRWLEDLTKLHKEVASRGARKLSAAGLSTEERVLQGDPREALIEEARKERADLIVVGSHGRTGLEKLLMGSVATHVVTHAPCSVMVVRPDAQDGRKHLA